MAPQHSNMSMRLAVSMRGSEMLVCEHPLEPYHLAEGSYRMAQTIQVMSQCDNTTTMGQNTCEIGFGWNSAQRFPALPELRETILGVWSSAQTLT